MESKKESLDMLIKEMKEHFESEGDPFDYGCKSYHFGIKVKGKVYNMTITDENLISYGSSSMDDRTEFLYTMVSKYPWVLELLLDNIDGFISQNDGNWEE